MTRWTQKAVEDAAPDASSLAAARKLATPGPWSETGSTDTLLWGKCQGSGKTPYQVSIDLTGPAYRCSCPSRKFPCKHALALLLLWTSGTAIVDAPEGADFAQEWAANRAQRDHRHAHRRTECAGYEAGRPDRAGQAPRDAPRSDGRRHDRPVVVVGRPRPSRDGRRTSPATVMVGHRCRSPGRRADARPG